MKMVFRPRGGASIRMGIFDSLNFQIADSPRCACEVPLGFNLTGALILCCGVGCFARYN